MKSPFVIALFSGLALVGVACGGGGTPETVEDLPSDEGYYEQPTTCLEWRTNYTQRWVSGGPTQRSTDQFGSGILESPPGHFEQVPTGQTCVREG